MKRSIPFLTVAFLLLAACDRPDPDSEVQPRSPLLRAKSAVASFEPLPADYATAEQTPVQVELGRHLFHERRLSKNHDISCNSCHNLKNFGVDGEPTSHGHGAVRGQRNSPSAYHVGGHSKQFWDGRTETLEEQAKEPVVNPIEMALPDGAHAVRVLKSIPGYVGAFGEAFPDQQDPVTFDNFAIAVGAYERTLMTPARWDAFLEGDDQALTEPELRGFNLFVRYECVECHSGALLGGQSFHEVGAAKPWPNQADKGRFGVSHAEEDRMVFKSPSLRNVAKTGPYFHDGSVTELDEAVRMMGVHQSGVRIPDDEVALIVTWLNALTGEIDWDHIRRPTPFQSGPETPARDPT